MKVMVAGSIGQRPGRGGHAWLFLQYLLGLKALGCEVLFVDRLEAEMCVDSSGRRCRPEDSVNAHYVADVMTSAGLASSYAVLVDHGRRALAMEIDKLLSWARSADLLIDVMGYLEVEALVEAPALRLFLDIDPGFPQLWCDRGLYDGFGHHDRYATFGANIGSAACTIPTCGISWTATRPPVLLSQWPSRKSSGRRVTTVCTWRGPFDAIEHDGIRYGLRVHRMRELVPLPNMVDPNLGISLELALDIEGSDSADKEHLRTAGWRLVEPLDVAESPESYRQYVQESAAEFLVPKDLYLRAHAGWFSDRSACYLASGKPVFALDPDERTEGDTRAVGSISGAYPVGKGLMTFGNREAAAEAIETVFSDYQSHADAARALAEEYFDSERVLEQLLDDIAEAA